MVFRFIEEKKKRLERKKRVETAKSLAAGTVIGTTLGALAGLLFAPKSGKDTRETIAIKSKEVAGNIKTTVNEQLDSTKEWKDKMKLGLKENLKEMMEKKEKITEDIKSGAEQVGEVVGKTAEVVKDEIKE